jgi:hypothetical protein
VPFLKVQISYRVRFRIAASAWFFQADDILQGVWQGISYQDEKFRSVENPHPKYLLPLAPLTGLKNQKDEKKADVFFEGRFMPPLLLSRF